MAYRCPKGLEAEHAEVIRDLKGSITYRAELNRTPDAAACRSFIGKLSELADRGDAESCNILGNIFAIDREDGWYWEPVPTDSRLSRGWYHRALRADCAAGIDGYLRQFRVRMHDLEMQEAADEELSDLLTLSASSPLYKAAVEIGDRYEDGSIEHLMYRLLAMTDYIEVRKRGSDWCEQEMGFFSALCTDLFSGLRSQGLTDIAAYAMDALRRGADGRDLDSANALLDVYLAMPDAGSHMEEISGLTRGISRSRLFKSYPGRNGRLIDIGTAVYRLGGIECSEYCFSKIDDLSLLESVADGFRDGSGIAEDKKMAATLYRVCRTPSSLRKLGCMYW